MNIPPPTTTTRQVLRAQGECIRGEYVPLDQLYFWTPEWQAREQQADEDFRAGRVYEATDVEDMIAELHREAARWRSSTALRSLTT